MKFATIGFLFISLPALGNYWFKIPAKNSQERTAIASLGIAIEQVADDFVVAYGNQTDLSALNLLGHSPLVTEASLDTFDFPPADARYHNYKEARELIMDLAHNNTDIVTTEVIGTSVEGREIIAIHITNDFQNRSSKPGAVYMGTHHAREHLSTEIPLMVAEYFVKEYRVGNPRIVNLVNTRHLMIIPIVNPDGLEYDIQTGRYQYWRKNRSRNADGSVGVDLNRNYGYDWGGQGASPNPHAETYRGPSAFSEPETRAIKSFIENNSNISTLLSFHSYSELILYPWGSKTDRVPNVRDYEVFKTFASKMAQFNHYDPMQASDLYVAAGDTCDWAYAEKKIFAFTFELDPKESWMSDGFYPGAGIIDEVFRKNLEPVLMMAEYADNPYRITGSQSPYGLSEGFFHSP